MTIGNITVAADAATLVAPGEFQINFTVPQRICLGRYWLSMLYTGASNPVEASVTVSTPIGSAAG